VKLWKSDDSRALRASAVRDAKACADEANDRLEAAVASESAVRDAVRDLRVLRELVLTRDLRIIRKKPA